MDAFFHRTVMDQRTYDRQTAKLDEEIGSRNSGFEDQRSWKGEPAWPRQSDGLVKQRRSRRRNAEEPG